MKSIANLPKCSNILHAKQDVQLKAEEIFGVIKRKLKQETFH